LPIWRTEDGTEEKCIGSIDELKSEILKANSALNLNQNPEEATLDLHRPYVDRITLVSESGKPMTRETDLIDVWFDSGAMPYAQWHWPFENKEIFEKNFPADFIAEGVDQTRGWFFTLHAIGVMLFDNVAFKNVIANGLVLDKNGNKMSKRLGNAVDPFTTVENYGADALRWYMSTNSQPWDNLKFDTDGVVESQRKFLGTLYNTYSFFAIYANIDQFVFRVNQQTPVASRSELDRWILSKLNSLILEVTEALDDYDPTKAARAIEEFVSEQLSNWYVRLSRRVFWKGEMNADKQAAYETLYTCLDAISRMMSPISPFFSDWLYRNLNAPIIANNEAPKSVHLTNWPVVNQASIQVELEMQMQRAQTICSLVLSLRKKEKIKVRQPLQKMLIPALTSQMKSQIEHVAALIQSEVNVKEIEYLEADNALLVKKIKPNFKTLGKVLGPHMKAMSAIVDAFTQDQIREIETSEKIDVMLNNETFTLNLTDVEIMTQDMPGWLVTSEGDTTVALDITISEDLMQEGMARELVNRIQNLRKELGFEVTDKIKVEYSGSEQLTKSVNQFIAYICSEVLATEITFVSACDTHETDVNEEAVYLNLKK
jgi:isoleucyl-tRNA synthetase